MPFIKSKLSHALLKELEEDEEKRPVERAELTEQEELVFVMFNHIYDKDSIFRQWVGICMDYYGRAVTQQGIKSESLAEKWNEMADELNVLISKETGVPIPPDMRKPSGSGDG